MKFTLHVFVCDSENYMVKNRLGIIFLENLVSVTQKNVIGIKFAIIRTRSTTTRDRNLQFRGTVSTRVFLNFLQWMIFFDPVSLCSLVGNVPKHGEIFPISGQREIHKSYHVSGCRGFFCPEIISDLGLLSTRKRLHMPKKLWGN